MEDFGCDNCKYLNGKCCKLWQVKVEDAHNSHCESGQHKVISIEKESVKV